MTEWRDIPGFEGHYQASVDGQIKSLARSYSTPAGYQRRIAERILRPGGGAYPSVVLRAPGGSRRTWKLHQLVARAFHGLSPFNGAEVCHRDGNPLNNHADNLRWGSRSENGLDSVRHGTNVHASKTECSAGHPYTPENTILRGPHKTRRQCRTCMRKYKRDSYARKAAS